MLPIIVQHSLFLIIENILNRKLYKLISPENKEDNEVYTIKKHIGLTSKKNILINKINFYNSKNEIINLDFESISIFNTTKPYEIKDFNFIK